MAYDIELKYGVHDISYKDSYVGFTSYEIEESNFHNLILDWEIEYIKRGWLCTYT